MKEEELHQKIKDFFKELNVGPVMIRFLPEFKVKSHINTEDELEYLKHDIDISFSTKLE